MIKNSLANSGITTVSLFGALALTANANLVLEITDAGAGQTRWVFSGTTDIVSGSTDRNGFWFDEPNLGGLDLVNFIGSVTPISGTFTGTAANGSLSLDDLFLRATGFGVRTTPFPVWGPGDTIGWTGDLLVGVPISNFSVGSFTGNGTIGTDGNFQTTSDAIQVNVESTPIPEVSGPCVLLGLIGLSLFGRRRIS